MTAVNGEESALRATVFEALSAAVAGADLRIRQPPGLAGAYVAGKTVDAYVVAVRDGFQVELWRADGANPFHIEKASNLTSAVAFAVTAVATSGGGDSTSAVHDSPEAS